MKAVKQQSRGSYVSPGVRTLLNELGEECQHVLKLLAKLKTAGAPEVQIETILGDLSAAVLHLHEHTRGLDEIIDEDRGTS